ncbi:PBECR4 domain-containing protein [Paenibacillus aceti]|uniref:PBECR4 domain-containing protein n=1 Tax=Paenibacillus aceti TaxID=1820010 RepID=UPI000EA3819F|nr:PBECR4 domain-containing protein [Paenibacillus aceti]HBF2207846.1 hypothetical protein [Clostridioides difficile]
MSLLDLPSLLALQVKPAINQIDLPLLQQFYETQLVPYTYVYNISSGEQITLKFEIHRFCHLLGIESIVERALHWSKRKGYKGSLGWENIKNGSLNFKHLKDKAGKTAFNSKKDKMLYFYLLPKLLNSTETIIKFHKVPGSNVECELLLFNQLEGVYIHLGIEKEDDGKSYYPRTFFIERITASNPGTRFIEDQPDTITVLSFEKLENPRPPEKVKNV